MLLRARNCLESIFIPVKDQIRHKTRGSSHLACVNNLGDKAAVNFETYCTSNPKEENKNLTDAESLRFVEM